MPNELNSKDHRSMRLALMIALVLATLCFRFSSFVFPVQFNFSPVNAIALFSGAYFTNRFQSFLVPLISIWLSDIFLNYLYMHEFHPFYSGFYWQYGVYALIVVAGILLSNKVNFSNILIGSLGSSILFFVVTNFGVWYSFEMYPKSLEGLVLCYEAAIPFFKNTVMSDLVFTSVLFGTAYLINKKYPEPALNKS